MKTITLIIKGILFYSTVILTLIFIMAIDALAEKSMLNMLIYPCLITLLSYTCIKTITGEELEKITFIKYIENLSK